MSDFEYDSETAEFQNEIEDEDEGSYYGNTEYSAKNNPVNIHQSAVQVLTQVPNITATQVNTWLHTTRLVSPIEEAFDDICTYVGNSQDHNFGIKIHDIIRIVRNNEHEFSRDEKRLRMLLWHGTQTCFVPSILEYGFKPPASKGQMFGAGIYFADRSSKSAQYCHAKLRPNIGDIGYMFLCEVILGNMYNAKNAKNNFTAAPQVQGKKGYNLTFDSVKCTGKFIPNSSEEVRIGRTRIPLGKTVTNMKYSSYTVQYNEFIVYNAEMVKPKYLLKIEFTPNKISY